MIPSGESSGYVEVLFDALLETEPRETPCVEHNIQTIGIEK